MADGDTSNDPKVITGKIIEAMVAKSYFSGADSNEIATDVAEAFKIVWQAVNRPDK